MHYSTNTPKNYDFTIRRESTRRKSTLTQIDGLRETGIPRTRFDTMNELIFLLEHPRIFI